MGVDAATAIASAIQPKVSEIDKALAREILNTPHLNGGYNSEVKRISAILARHRKSAEVSATPAQSAVEVAQQIADKCKFADNVIDMYETEFVSVASPIIEAYGVQQKRDIEIKYQIIYEEWEKATSAHVGARREGVLMRMALEKARKFIADEYADPKQEEYGHWLSREARPVHDAICEALYGGAALSPDDIAGGK